MKILKEKKMHMNKSLYSAIRTIADKQIIYDYAVHLTSFCEFSVAQSQVFDSNVKK